MTVNINDGFLQTLMVGGETTVDFDFLIYAKADMKLLKTSTLGVITTLALTTDYTIADAELNDPTGGVIGLVVPASAGEKYTALSNMAETRSSDFQQGGDFFSATLNTQLDRLTRISQQHRRDINKSVQLGGDSTFGAVTIEDPEDGTVQYWSTADGKFINGPTVTEIANAQGYSEDASDFADAAAASAIAAAASAASLSGTSTTSLLIGTGTKILTTQPNKMFDCENLRVYSAADNTNFMDGIATYSGTTCSVDVTAVGGSGTLTDWVIKVNGARGATGATGATGPAGSVSDGDKGDITVSGAGTIFTIDAGVVTEAKMVTADNTTNNATTAKHGFMPKAANSAATYYDSLGTQTNPALNAVLTGYTSGAGTVASTDTILQAIQKLNGNDATSAGKMALLGTSTASTSSSLNFTSVITSAYDLYFLVFKNLLFSGTGTLQYLSSSNNGSTYAVTQSHQKWTITTGGTTAPTYTGAAGAMLLSTSSATPTLSGVVKIVNPLGTHAQNAPIESICNGESGSGLIYRTFGYSNDSAAVNAVQIKPSSGNFTSGVAYLFGVKNT